MKIKLPHETELKIDQKVNALILKAFNETSKDDPAQRMLNVVELLKTTLKSELSQAWFEVDSLKSENKNMKKDYLGMIEQAEKERDLYKERVMNKK